MFLAYLALSGELPPRDYQKDHSNSHNGINNVLRFFQGKSGGISQNLYCQNLVSCVDCLLDGLITSSRTPVSPTVGNDCWTKIKRVDVTLVRVLFTQSTDNLFVKLWIVCATTKQKRNFFD